MINSNGMYVEVNLPDAPKGEGLHKLPPYNRQKAYLVDEYPGCPNNWPRSSKDVSSYFLPVEPGQHLWLDLNHNFYNSHYVAALINVQGINPITGQKPSKELEQYKDKCPVHNIEFKANRYCDECKFKWPSQNYMTTASIPNGLFWIDGWRTGDNEIRGFLITSETMRGVAAQLIGNERVFAIGIAFYLSKSRKRINKFKEFRDSFKNSDYQSRFRIQRRINTTSLSPANTEIENRILCCADSKESTLCDISDSTPTLEIGAGAKINQELSYNDNLSVSDYNDNPETTIYINYCTKEQFDAIMKCGKSSNEGFLTGMKVGN